MLPFLRYRQTPNVVQERLYTLAQLFLEDARPGNQPEYGAHATLYVQRPLSARIQPSLPSCRPTEATHRIIFLGRLLVVQGYLHSNQSSTIRVRLERKGDDDVLAVEGDVNKEASKAIRRLTASLFELRSYANDSDPASSPDWIARGGPPRRRKFSDVPSSGRFSIRSVRPADWVSPGSRRR